MDIETHFALKRLHSFRLVDNIPLNNSYWFYLLMVEGPEMGILVALKGMGYI